jgi:type I restriction enzyme, S subunit
VPIFEGKSSPFGLHGTEDTWFWLFARDVSELSQQLSAGILGRSSLVSFVSSEDKLMHQPVASRTYNRRDSVVFRKTREPFGGLSNMASGFPLEVNEVRIRTVEALYQACRFPQNPKLQRLIIQQRSPMTAKMLSKPYRKETRPDWDKVRVTIMRWCLRVKLAQNWHTFGALLHSTGDSPIVEESRKDDFWGAKAVEEDMLVGVNVLGRLLMELREELRSHDASRLRRVEPPQISQFYLYTKPIGSIKAPASAHILPASIDHERDKIIPLT